MATPTMLPMLDKDGNPGMVPADRVNDAISQAGMRVGFHVQSATGELGVIPAERLGDFLKVQGNKLYQHPQDPTQFEQERTHNAVGSTIGHFAKEAASIPVGMAAAAGQVFNPGAGMQAAADLASADTERAAAGRSTGYRVAAGVGSALGVNARGMEEAAEKGDTGGVLGTALADAGAAAAFPKVAEKLKAMGEARAAAKVYDAPKAADAIVRGVNIGAEARPKARADLAEVLPHIADHVERGEVPGVTLKNMDRGNFLKAARSAAEDHQQLYNEQLLDPIKDRTAPNGKTFAENEARLRHLNRTTNYNPTTVAESEAQVARKAEAASLREVQNQGMARELGVTPDKVEMARSAGEKLRDLADKTEYAMDLEQHGKDTAERGSPANVHASPHGAYVTSGGRVGAAVRNTAEKVLGHPGDTAIRKAFSNLNVGKPEIATPNVGAADRANQELTAADRAKRTPLNDTQKRAVAQAAANKTGLSETKPAPGSTATISENLEATKRRQAEVATGRDKRRFDQQAQRLSKEAERDVNRASHGKTAAAVDAGLSKWPAEYRKPRTQPKGGNGGANYTAAELAAFKKKHNL